MFVQYVYIYYNRTHARKQEKVGDYKEVPQMIGERVWLASWVWLGTRIKISSAV